MLVLSPYARFFDIIQIKNPIPNFKDGDFRFEIPKESHFEPTFDRELG